MNRGSRGFTLVELLIVVSIGTILLGIAVPNYLNARIRGQIAVAHANLKRVETALEWYASDHGKYPFTTPRFPTDPLALLADHQLQALTTPIAYLGADSFRDPFGLIEAQFIQPALSSGNDFPRLNQPNLGRSLLYYHYPSLAVRLDSPQLAIEGASAVSIGPDKKDSLGAYRPFDVGLFDPYFPGRGAHSSRDTIYSPTNGVTSEGDIGAFVGEGRRFRLP